MSAGPLTPKELLRGAAQVRIEHAMALIERAQNDLAAACSELSALEGGIPVWNATSKLTDRVHAHWYRVKRFLDGGRFKLDQLNREAVLARHREARP